MSLPQRGLFVVALSLFRGGVFRADSHLSVRYTDLVFTQHALPPATIEDVDAMNNDALAHNLAYAAL